MTRESKRVVRIIVAAIVLLSLVVACAQRDIQEMGVTNLSSLHLKDTGETATPVFMVNQEGTGAIAVFEDAGTPVASIYDGGATNWTGAMDFDSTLDMSNNAISNIGAAGTDFSATGGLSLAAPLVNAAGTYTLPQITWTDDTNMGFYRVGADNIGVSLAGALDFDFGANDLDFNTSIATNIGNAGTDFDTDGGLTLASDLTVTSALFYPGFADETITDGETLTPTVTIYALDSGGNVTVTLAASGTDGQLLYLIGDDNNTVTVADTNIRTSDGNKLEIGQYDVVGFVYQDAEWILLFQSNNS